MRVRRLLGYGDAVVLLGRDRPALIALDTALGGALSLATGGFSESVLSLFDAQGRILRIGRDLTAGLRTALGASSRAERSRRLAAAHTVIVVTAYFEAFGETRLPFAQRELDLTRRDQLRLAGGSAAARDFLDQLVGAAPPMPAPHLPYEQALDELRTWCEQLSGRLLFFVRGLAVWDGLDDTGREATRQALGDDLCARAVDRYEELFARLAVDVPEFAFWSSQVEHQGTRAELRQALAGMESLLAGLWPARRPTDLAAALSAAYRAVLDRPVLADGEVPTAMRLPTLGEGYFDPDFTVRPVAGQDGPAREEWWAGAPVRRDLTEYLAGAFTSPGTTAAPLVVLGQPGAGKSVLTKVLAARLPAAGFLPVRVALREVPAEADIQDQIECAVRAATGEPVSWPDLVRSAGGAMPVVLLDGFDELLQATGVSQSDYLVKVARFQQREADQGRPVIALVTSRTAVADRARYPHGAVALRLEPFRSEQIDSWLDGWNRSNASYFAAQGLAPLPPAVVARHHALASQPLLLLMLALYDAADNALQQGDDAGAPLGEAELYEALLTAFAGREVAKTGAGLPDRELAAQVERELQRLSLIAFGMLNRRRQWITSAELEEDLAALLGRSTVRADGFRAPLGQAEIALGRFFFVQRAQAVQDSRRLSTYEFLHATFGEYLAARLAVQLVTGLLGQRPVLIVGPAPVDDDLLYALLSFAPLSSRQILRFVAFRLGQLEDAGRTALKGLLIRVLSQCEERTEHRYADYRPARPVTSSRHGVYSANLFLLLLFLSGGITTSELFPESDDPPGTWHRRILLWRSSFNEQQWTDFAVVLLLRHTWHGSQRDLEIRPAADGRPGPLEPVDPYWLYRYPPGNPSRGNVVWSRTYWQQVQHKMDVSGGTNDSVVRHAMDPVFEWLGPTVSTFVGVGDGPASSAAHDLIRLWLSSRLGAPVDDVVRLYRRCSLLLGLETALPGDTRDGVALLLIGLLHNDADRLPPDLFDELMYTVALNLSAEGLQALSPRLQQQVEEYFPHHRP
ncbi:NACHT domain-containing protein [Streptomyces cinnamoneus]|nr:hypothetical protein [Streptomyces cinnamoneus]